jgi:hypothetical protein
MALPATDEFTALANELLTFWLEMQTAEQCALGKVMRLLKADPYKCPAVRFSVPYPWYCGEVHPQI